MQDGEIISLIAERDEAGLAALREKYGQYLLKIAYNILGDRLDAEEAQNDALLGVWEAVPGIMPQNLKSFSAKLCRRSATDILRRSLAKKRGSGELESSLDELFEAVSGGRNPEEELEYKALGEEISAWLGELAPKKRAVFVMRYFYADSISAISRCTGDSEANVKTLLCRLRKSLKKRLENS